MSFYSGLSELKDEFGLFYYIYLTFPILVYLKYSEISSLNHSRHLKSHKGFPTFSPLKNYVNFS